MKSYKDYDDLSDSDELKYSKKFLKQLKEVLGGDIVTRKDEDGEIDFFYLKFTHENRPYRIKIYQGWGTPELHARISNRRGLLAINLNRKIKPEYFTNDPNWDDIDKITARLFLAPGIFINEYSDEMSQMVNLLDEMPDTFLDDITGFIDSNNVEYLLYDATVVEVRYQDDVFKMDYEKTIKDHVKLIESHCRFLESGSRTVTPKPKVYISGKPAQTSAMPGIKNCSYCKATVLLSESGKCRNCGAPM